MRDLTKYKIGARVRIELGLDGFPRLNLRGLGKGSGEFVEGYVSHASNRALVCRIKIHGQEVNWSFMYACIDWDGFPELLSPVPKYRIVDKGTYYVTELVE